MLAATLDVLMNNGDGKFRQYKTYPAGQRPNFVATGDFNNDTKLDLVTCNTNRVTIL